MLNRKPSSTRLRLEALETRDVPSTIVAEPFGGIQYLAILEPNGGNDGLGAIVRMNPTTGAVSLVSDNAVALNGGVFQHPNALTLETINGVGYLTFLDPTGGPDGLGSIVRINPYTGGSQMVSNNALALNGGVFQHPSDLITEITSAGTEYLTFVDPTGGPDGMGSIVRINPFTGGSQLVSDNATSNSGGVFDHPSALTLETINGIGYLTMLDPTGGADSLGSIVRINPYNGGAQVVADNAISGGAFNQPADIVTEGTGNGTQYLALLDGAGGSDGLGALVRINPSNGGAQLVSDNAVAGETVFEHPTALTLETINGVGYLTLMNPPSEPYDPGQVVRINPTSGGAQLVSYPQAPLISSAAAATFTVGKPGSFTITTSGNPTATLTESGTLPAGVTFVDNGNGTATLSGTPLATTVRATPYSFTLTASNGVAPNFVQTFKLTIGQPPVITSAANATFVVGMAGSFTITTSGYPTAAFTESGTLPAGVTFTDNGNGTATLRGTPKPGTARATAYTFTVTAHNGSTPNFVQTFQLTVDQPPVITSAASATFTAGTAASFTIKTAPALPAKVALSESGTLPAGVTFTDNGNGTATLTGTPHAGSGGVYKVTITAKNGVLSATTLMFTLTIDAPIVFTSASMDSFIVHQSNTLTISTTGYPAATTITVSGTLPIGVTLVNKGNGIATLSGSPSATGKFQFTLLASVGGVVDARQTFDLTVVT